MHSAKKIIIAEDDHAISEVLTIILQEAGYETTVMTTYKDIFSALQSHSYDLLLLDIWLSGEDGAEICKKLKDDKGIQDIPIILLSANEHIYEVAKKVHADDVVQKPFDVDNLVLTVRKHLV